MKMGFKVSCLLAIAAAAADTRRLGYVMDDTTIQTAVNDWLDNATIAEAAYGHISTWDTSGVTDMRKLFCGGQSCLLKKGEFFNDDISAWDTSGVTAMWNMFSRAYSFNQPIGSWDVSKVEGLGMAGVFQNAKAFNQPLGDWRVDKVTSMSQTFYGAEAFNQPIGGWRVDSVTGMSSMFQGASSFNQDLSNWRVEQVNSMHNIFQDAIAFDQDLGWCVGDRVFGDGDPGWTIQDAFLNTLCASTNCGVTQGSCDTVDSAFSVARTPAVAVVAVFAILFGLL